MRKSIASLFLASALLGASVSVIAVEQLAAQPAAAVAATETVNLNTADANALSDGLIGIGDAKARAIIEYREANGPFTSVEDLLEIKGIGTAILEKNRARLSL